MKKNSIALDENTRLHNKRVEVLMATFLQAHSHLYSYGQELIIAARIHDIGKIWIPEEILNAPRKLTVEERKTIDWHAYYGYELAKAQGYSDTVCKLVLYHHGEDKPKKEDINVSEEIKRHAALLRVIDAYDALTSKRAYHDEFSDERVMDILTSGQEFDHEAVTLLAAWSERKDVLASFTGNLWYIHFAVLSNLAKVPSAFNNMNGNGRALVPVS